MPQVYVNMIWVITYAYVWDEEPPQESVGHRSENTIHLHVGTVPFTETIPQYIPTTVLLLMATILHDIIHILLNSSIAHCRKLVCRVSVQSWVRGFRCSSWA